MRKFCLLFCLFFSLYAEENKAHVGLCIMATGCYNAYATKFIQSCRKHFLNNHQVTYYVFTDGEVENAPDVVKVHQERLGWPFDTMMRFEVFAKQETLYKDLDYLYASDADMLFVADVKNEILSDLVGTMHPGFISKRGTYETNPKSSACVNPDEGTLYFAGGFYGGRKENVLTLWKTCGKNVNQDLKQEYVALWHDESHINRYFIDHFPTHVLTPAYCCPESQKLPFSVKLLALDKNHEAMRQL
ncbi:MAG: hypothetical protein WDZ28_01250 [Simkaniaceae bacterium]